MISSILSTLIAATMLARRQDALTDADELHMLMFYKGYQWGSEVECLFVPQLQLYGCKNLVMRVVLLLLLACSFVCLYIMKLAVRYRHSVIPHHFYTKTMLTLG